MENGSKRLEQLIELGNIKLDIGCGRMKGSEMIGIDIMPFVDGNGRQVVDVVMDIEKEELPFETGTVNSIRINNVLEHISELKFVLNECWRVLKYDGVMVGNVPVAGSKKDFQDPTHKRHFIPETFGYFTGVSLVNTNWPSHPRYANYGFKPWSFIEDLKVKHDEIYFNLAPRKSLIKKYERKQN